MDHPERMSQLIEMALTGKFESILVLATPNAKKCSRSLFSSCSILDLILFLLSSVSADFKVSAHAQ